MESQKVADEILGSATIEHGTAVVRRPKRQVFPPGVDNWVQLQVDDRTDV